jgi:uncharacterized protein YjbI with pentapeptide repeats
MPTNITLTTLLLTACILAGCITNSPNTAENSMTHETPSERPDPFDAGTPNDPVDTSDWGRKMIGSVFCGCNMPNTRFDGCIMGNATFSRSALDRSTFDDVGLRGCTFNNISLGDAKITNSCLVNLELDGNMTGMVISGVPLRDLLEAYEQVTGTRVDCIEWDTEEEQE